MNKMYLFKYLLLWGFPFGLTLAVGADTESGKYPANQLITLMMLPNVSQRDVNSVEDVATTFVINTNAGRVPVNLTPGVDAGPYLRKAEANLEAFRPLSQVEPGKAPVLASIAKAEFPSTWRNILVLVMADPAGQKVRLTAINQGSENLPAGFLGVYNVTQSAISLKLGDQIINLESFEQGKIRIVASDPNVGPSMFSFMIAMKDRDTWKLEYTTRVALNPAERRLALIFPGPRTRTQHYIFYPAPPDPVNDDPAPASNNKTIATH